MHAGCAGGARGNRSGQGNCRRPRLAGRGLHARRHRAQRAAEFTHFTVKDPERLVVDLEGVEFSGVLEQLSSKIAPDDPNIKLLRAGRFKPGVVRLVMELKNEVKPQVFELAPVGNYGHRLVLDVYPLVPPDPMLQLLAKHECSATICRRR
jgi:hypothetical protein